MSPHEIAALEIDEQGAARPERSSHGDETITDQGGNVGIGESNCPRERRGGSPMLVREQTLIERLHRDRFAFGLCARFGVVEAIEPDDIAECRTHGYVLLARGLIASVLSVKLISAPA